MSSSTASIFQNKRKRHLQNQEKHKLNPKSRMEEQTSRFERMTNGENSILLILLCKCLMHCCQLIQWPYFVALLQQPWDAQHESVVFHSPIWLFMYETVEV